MNNGADNVNGWISHVPQVSPAQRSTRSARMVFQRLACLASSISKNTLPG